jgi:RNA polymerase sigma-70 factor (ECF subfamily)
MEPEEFRRLLRQVRAGDADAAARLVREFEPAIRRFVRVRLADARLRRVLDSMDICQSVMANFFVRVAAGQFDLEQPRQLLRLLATMARNRLLNHARDELAARRDRRRQEDNSNTLDQAADPGASPSRIAMGKELLERVEQQLDPQERLLLQRRLEGHEWQQIAAEMKASPEALRKKLARALDRIGPALGLDAVTDENQP